MVDFDPSKDEDVEKFLDRIVEIIDEASNFFTTEDSDGFSYQDERFEELKDKVMLYLEDPDEE